MNAIEVSHVSFSYADQPTIVDASFSIKENEYVGLMGPNGGGKSTLIKLLLGLLKPDAGHIRIFGKSPEESASLIGYVPQTLGFDRQFPISVKEVVMTGRISRLGMFGNFKPEDYQYATECLKVVGMESFEKAAFGSLSGGEMQRVLIARALASKPKLLLLDEPTASVDNKAESEIYKLLKSLNKEMTILIVTHDLNEAIHQVDRLLLVQRTVTPLTLAEVCEHFAIGLYHTPLQANHLTQLKRSDNP